jgi:hypothetical protein
MTGGVCASSTPNNPTPPDVKAVYQDNLRKINAIKTSHLLYLAYQYGQLPTGLDDETLQMLTHLMMDSGPDGCRISKCAEAMRRALRLVEDLRADAAAGWTMIQLGLVPAGAGGGFIPSRRWQAVQEAWAIERDLVATTGQGTRRWTPAEKQELVQTGRVEGYIGHHINSVKAFPELEPDPNNIAFVDDHLAQHAGNWRNPTTGPLMDRTFDG